jgi:hypothetical protein
MRPFLSYILALSLSLWACGAIAQARAQAETTTPAVEAAPNDGDSTRLLSYRVRIVGEWEEFAPSRNYVDFFADGRVVLYLKKGEVGDLKTLNGTWSLQDENQLRVAFDINGRSIEQISTLGFERDALLLIDANGTVTRHRKRSGPLPEEYRW